MHIVLTNDDGIYADGILALYDALRTIASVTVVAPDVERSAVGHAITMSLPLRVHMVKRRAKLFGYAVSGTPADCVKIAVRSLLKRKPDLVVSGINLGPNTGFSVLYSGTVSGATEGAILGIPSFAVSLGAYSGADYGPAAAYAARFAKAMRRQRIPKGTFFNINVPACPSTEIRGVRVTSQGTTPIIDTFVKRCDPRKRTYYWLTGEVIKLHDGSGTDIMALKQKYISVTPIKYDLTDYAFLDDLKSWGGVL